MTSNRHRGGKTRKLYRDPERGKICGVCAGVANYFGFELWVVRIICISLILLGLWGPMFLAYFVLYFVLDPDPRSRTKSRGWNEQESHHYQGDEDESRPYRPSVKEVWRSGLAPDRILKDIEYKFEQVESKLQKIESYVTSSRFELEREFSKMER